MTMPKIKQLLVVIVALLASGRLMGDSVPMSPGIAIQPRVIESARDLMHIYPSSATLVLPELSVSEEHEIIDLISQQDIVYLTIKRDILYTTTNWKLLGTKKASDIWQLHIKSPRAVGMQVWFSQATLPPDLKIKIYAGQKGITSHLGEYLGSRSESVKSFWSTQVRGDTIVIEVWAPQGSNLNPSNFPFEIKSINHYFRTDATDNLNLRHFAFAASNSTPCNVVNPPTCPAQGDFPSYQAVARLNYTQPNGRAGTCTGGFINNRQGDGELYLLTALHCIKPGFSENTAKGTAISGAQIRTAVSRCSTSSERLVSNDIKFIAANERADWALLWVNKNNLQRVDGSSSTLTTPVLLGWDSSLVQVRTSGISGTSLENLHFGGGSVQQSYAKVEVRAFSYKTSPISGILTTHNFILCPDINLCTHYAVSYDEGGTAGGASGSLVWSTRDRVRGVITHGSCRAAQVSRFRKMYEDGRVKCALDSGSAYYPSETSTCTDSARPIYEPLLTSLSPSTGTIYPNFNSGSMHYTIVVGNHVGQITLTMLRNDRFSEVTVLNVNSNQTQVTSVPTLSLDEGLNTIVVRVRSVPTDLARSLSRYYVVKVIRLPRQTINPVGTWENAYTDRYLQCRSNPLPLSDSRLFVSEITRTSENKLSILSDVLQDPYTEIDRLGPNRATLSLHYDIRCCLGTDTVHTIAISDKEIIGVGTDKYLNRRLNIPCSISYVSRFRSVSLDSLSIQGVTLNPSFRSAIKNYTATVGSDIEQLVIRASTSYSSQTVSINSTSSPLVPLQVGENTIAIKVASQRSSATSLYTLQVTRLGPPQLTTLRLSAGTLSPRFDSDTASYTAVVGNAISQIDVIATANNSAYRVTINGTTSPIVPLQIGENTITIEVSSQESSTTATYTLRVTRLGLTALHLSAGTLSPRFDSDTTSYTAAVGHTVSHIDIATTADSSAHTITINGTSSSLVPLRVGENTITIELSSEGSATATYTLQVIRLGLIALRLSAGMLSPRFNSDITSYTAVVGNTVSQINIAATASAHIITINGTTSSIVPLQIGENTITLELSLEEGSATLIYTLQVTRLEPRLSELSLSAGTLSPRFSNDTTSYTAVVGNTVSQINIAATADSSAHTITINGTSSPLVPLQIGENTIIIEVSSQEGSATSIYTLQVTRLGLTALRLSAATLSPRFASDITSYTAVVSNVVRQIKVATTATRSAHTITINGTSSPIVPLQVGDNTITIELNSQKSSATAIYTLQVTRLGLIALRLSAGTLSPRFDSDTASYTAVVGNTVNQIDVVVTADSSAPTITINGSQNTAVPLVVGNNTIVIELRSAEGEATATYVVMLRRLGTATLTGLVVEIDSQKKILDPTFSTEILNYAVNINRTNSITLKPTAEVGRAIRVRYTPRSGAAIDEPVPSGDAIVIAPLSSGLNTVYVDVMHNGSMERYILMVHLGFRVRLKLFLEGALQ